MKRAGQLNPSEFRERLFDRTGEDTGKEELRALLGVLAAGPAPPDPDDPSVGLGTTKPDYSEPDQL